MAGNELRWEETARGYEIVVPRLRAHEVVVIEFAASWPDRPERFEDNDPLRMIRAPRGVLQKNAQQMRHTVNEKAGYCP